MNPLVAACLWIYRRLARAFPYEFQTVYGDDLVRLGEDSAPEIWKRHGFFGLVRLLADLAVRIPVEHLAELRQDVLYAMRTLVNSPGFAAVGIVSLGLAIGINTASFTSINSLLRTLPAARDPQKLVALQAPVAYPYFERYRDRHDLFSGVTAYLPSVPFSVATAAGSKPERVYGHLVSPEYFSVLGVNVARGRVLSPKFDKPGTAPVVVISDRFWRDRLNADPFAVGRILRINGQAATIAGIAPKDFLGVAPYPTPADLWMPLTVGARLAPELGDNVLNRRDMPIFQVLMRLAPGVTTPTAQAALDTITRQIDRENAGSRDAKDPRVRLLPGGSVIQVSPEGLRVVYLFVGTLMGLILTIACMNLANMLLARASARRKEIAIRLAVGASRLRIVRQMLTESVLLSMCGGLAGVVFASWLLHGLKSLKMPVQIPIDWSMIRPDWHVLLFTFAVSVAAGIGFGLAPALQATNTDLAPALKEGAVTQLRAYRRFGLRNLLVTYQVAGSLMLLLITGFLVIGYSRLTRPETGIDDAGLYLLSIDPMHDGYSAQRAAEFLDTLPEQLQRVSGIRAAALADEPPLTLSAGDQKFTGPASGDAPARVLSGAIKPAIGAGYFATLGLPVLRGREFTLRDQRQEPGEGVALPAILSESAVRELFGAADPLGRRISGAAQSYDVVGVVRDVKSTGGAIPAVYVPLNRFNFSHPRPFGLTLMVRGAGGPEALARLDPNLSIFNVHSLHEQLAEMDAYLRVGVVEYGSMGLFGLILASMGLAGVTAYSVVRRRKEIGIRMALGARPGQVLRLVLREGAALVAAGSVLGFAGAYGISRALATVTNQMAKALETGTNDPLLIAGAPLLLAGLAMLACYLPARKITKLDPLTALREE